MDANEDTTEAVAPAIAEAPVTEQPGAITPWCGEYAETFQQWLRENIAGTPLGRDTAHYNDLFAALPALAQLLSTPAK